MDSLNKVVMLIAISTVLTTAAVGQQVSGFAGMVNAGVISTKHFASSVENLYPDSIRFGNGYTIIGADIYYRNGRAILSVSGYMGLQGSLDYGDKILERSLWMTHAGLGYVLWSNEKVTFYPSVTFGVTSLSLTEHRQHSATHVEMVNKTIPSADFSLHFDYLMTDASRDDQFVDGIILGIQSGYNYGISSTTPFQGWYLTVSVGGLAFMKKKG